MEPLIVLYIVAAATANRCGADVVRAVETLQQFALPALWIYRGLVAVGNRPLCRHQTGVCARDTSGNVAT